MNNLIIGIGDLHGHYRALERLLDALQKKCGIFRESSPDRLREGVHLIFTGDYIDRGRHALRIIDRLQRLAGQNPGQVITLLGNHELMALEGYDEAAELLRRSTTGSSRGLVAAYGRLTDHGGNGGTEFIREFGATSLPAFESYVERMARTGDIGQWMRMLLPAHRTRIAGHGVLFMHADLPEKYRDEKVLEDQLRWIEEQRSTAIESSTSTWACAERTCRRRWCSAGTVSWA